MKGCLVVTRRWSCFRRSIERIYWPGSFWPIFSILSLSDMDSAPLSGYYEAVERGGLS